MVVELPPPCKIGCFALTRLNADSSWLIDYYHDDSGHTSAPTRIILDPWFDESPGIDGCTCFSATWPNMQTSICIKAFEEHGKESKSTDVNRVTTSSSSTSPLTSITSIVVSLPFSDHCHEATLLRMPAKIPIFAANGSYRRIKCYLQKHDDAMNTRVVIDLTTKSGIETFASHNRGLNFQSIESKFGMLDPTHRGVQFKDNDSKRGIIYAPHGLRLSTKKAHELNESLSTISLLSTTKLFQLPLLLGGTVNLGFDNSMHLVKMLNVADFFPTHSSVGGTVTGLVSHLANVRSTDDDVVADHIPSFRLALHPVRGVIGRQEDFKDHDKATFQSNNVTLTSQVSSSS